MEMIINIWPWLNKILKISSRLKMREEDIKNLVPTHKFDDSTIGALMQVDEKDVQLILPELLGWIADCNWPIARDMLKVLSRFPDSLIPLLRSTLTTGDDDILKYWIIVCLVPLFPVEAQKKLLPEIRRIAEYPTESEEEEEVCEVACDFIQNHGLSLS